VVKKKDTLLVKRNIGIWRLHDYIHSYNPHGVFYRVTKKMAGSVIQKLEATFIIPAASFKSIAEHLKKRSPSIMQE